MKNLFSVSVAAVAAAFVVSGIAATAQEAPAAPARVVGEKIDSGLGDLPHYSKWADPTGKNPLKTVVARDPAAAQNLALQVSPSK